MTDVNELDFTIEMNVEGVGDPLENDLFIMADEQLRSLSEGHQDLIGAAVTIRQPGEGVGSTYLYEATVVAYVRPTNIAAAAKDGDPASALRQALKSVEKQVRKQRDKKGKPWERPQQGPVDQEIEEVMAAEMRVDSERKEE